MMSGINKVKKFFIKVVAFIGLALLPVGHLYAEVYMNMEQAKEVLWQATAMSPVAIVLTNDQMDAIEDASGIWVGNENLKAWKTETGGWFIIDQVVGKHEMIDLAIAFTNEGKVKGMEVLQYREAYGAGVKHPKWLAQFLGKDHTEHLQLGKQIHNLSGGTLSSRHIMEGVTRLTHTWNQVLRHL